MQSRSSVLHTLGRRRAVVTLVALLAWSAPALAQIGSPINTGNSGRRYGIIPLRIANAPTVTPVCSNPRVSYFGGPVISDVQVVPVLWNSNVNGEIQANIRSFYSDAVESPWYEVLGEYSTTSQWIGPGASSSAITIVPSLCPASVTTSCNLTDAQLQTELNNQVQNGVLPTPQQDGAGNTYTAYMVYFPPNVKLTGPSGVGKSCVDFCAYHSTATFGGGNTPLAYGVVMDTYSGTCSTGCGDGPTALDTTTEVSSHELAEIVTDPDVGLDTQSAYAFPAAWADNNNNCGEIADICDASGSGATITVDGRTWVIQQIWSNKQNKCAASGPILFAPNLSVSAVSRASIGAAVMFTVTVNNASPPQGAGSIFASYAGTVHFTSTDSKAELPADFTYVPGDEGTANFAATFNSAGSQTITATDTRNGEIVGTSGPISVDGTNMATSCPETFAENQSIAITATVSGSNPTGSVNFQSGGTVLCSAVPLSSASATCQTPALAIQGDGTSYVYNVVANYSGDAGNSPSSSLPLSLTVLRASDVVFRSGLEMPLLGCPM